MPDSSGANRNRKSKLRPRKKQKPAFVSGLMFGWGQAFSLTGHLLTAATALSKRCSKDVVPIGLGVESDSEGNLVKVRPSRAK
jgi:hypothetical protein